jgi:hypothetical protein
MRDIEKNPDYESEVETSVLCAIDREVDRYRSATHYKYATLKRCACGATYTRKQWRDLPRVGEQYGNGNAVLELRNCKCGSTLAVEITRGSDLL